MFSVYELKVRMVNYLEIDGSNLSDLKVWAGIKDYLLLIYILLSARE